MEGALDFKKEKKIKQQSLQEAGTRVPDRQSPRRGERDRDDVSQRGKSRDDSNEGAKRKRGRHGKRERERKRETLLCESRSL